MVKESFQTCGVSRSFQLKNKLRSCLFKPYRGELSPGQNILARPEIIPRQLDMDFVLALGMPDGSQPGAGASSAQDLGRVAQRAEPVRQDSSYEAIR